MLISNKQTYLTIANGPKLGISDGGATGASYFELEVNGQTTANISRSPDGILQNYDNDLFHLIGTYDGINN
jgi:hypothetical protein